MASKTENLLLLVVCMLVVYMGPVQSFKVSYRFCRLSRAG